MNQYANKLLHFLQSEYQRTGKNCFTYPDMLQCIPDVESLDKAIDQLKDAKAIQKTEYISTFKLLELTD